MNPVTRGSAQFGGGARARARPTNCDSRAYIGGRTLSRGITSGGRRTFGGRGSCDSASRSVLKRTGGGREFAAASTAILSSGFDDMAYRASHYQRQKSRARARISYTRSPRRIKRRRRRHLIAYERSDVPPRRRTRRGRGGWNRDFERGGDDRRCAPADSTFPHRQRRVGQRAESTPP